jgi:transposase
MRMFIGLDVHKDYLQAAVLDAEGQLVKQQRITNARDDILNFLQPYDKSKVVIESSTTWYPIYQLLSDKHEVTLSNPAKTKAIAQAKVKTDKIDALTLAKLLRGGFIAESYIPPSNIINLRQLVRYRAGLVRLRTIVKNKIHAQLLMQGIRITDYPFTKPFNEKLQALDDYKINGYLNLLESLNHQITDASRRIRRTAEHDEAAKLLMTIPGVGYYSALLVASEIGDVNRFPDSHHLCSYAGLTPSTHSSGGVTYHGHITKTGSKYLRWVLTECTRTHVRLNPHSNLTRFYLKLAKRKGDAKAIVATSTKLLKITYWLLKENRPYRS